MEDLPAPDPPLRLGGLSSGLVSPAAVHALGELLSVFRLRPLGGETGLTKGEPAALFCDLFDRTTNTLVEAKGSVSRPAFRMAIGQLADYARFVNPHPK